MPAAQGHETYCSTDFGCLATNTWPTTNKGATFSNTRFPDARTFSPPLLVRRRCRAHSRAGSSTGTRLPSPRLSFVLLPLPRAACAPRGRLPCRHPPVFAPPLLFPRRCGTLFTPPPSIDPRLAPPLVHGPPSTPSSALLVVFQGRPCRHCPPLFLLPSCGTLVPAVLPSPSYHAFPLTAPPPVGRRPRGSPIGGFGAHRPPSPMALRVCGPLPVTRQGQPCCGG